MVKEIKQKIHTLPHKAIDIGTMNIISAKKLSNGKIKTKRIRDAFLNVEISAFTEKMLQSGNINYIEKDGEYYIIGDDALDFGKIFNKEIRRPLKSGLISPREKDAFGILSLMIESLLKKAKPNEKCVYGVPAAPIDSEQDVIYHSSILGQIVSNLGYKAIEMREAHAIAFSEAEQDDFSCIGISMGAGMSNVCLTYRTLEIPQISFSVARGGDHLDSSAAKVRALNPSRITSIKESGIDLLNPKNGDEEAIVIYYKALIKYVLQNVINKIIMSNEVQIDTPIPIIVAGGTSMAKNFLPIFKEVFKEVSKGKFPIPISEIRQAEDPLGAVAQGLLVASQL